MRPVFLPALALSLALFATHTGDLAPRQPMLDATSPRLGRDRQHAPAPPPAPPAASPASSTASATPAPLRQLGVGGSALPASGPLGYRHRNYWNLKKPYRGEWAGTVGYDKYGHVIFGDPAYGVRAAIHLLQTYQLRHRLDTVEAIINRWAPPDLGNPTSDYARKVARDLGIAPDDPVRFFDARGQIRDLEKLKAIMKSMAQFECGADFTLRDEEFQRGLALFKG
jgi:hypothetical protein